LKDDLLDAYWQGQEKEPVKKSKMKKKQKEVDLIPELRNQSSAHL
jgi:hypothetical protein